jgi:hypothetical protein
LNQKSLNPTKKYLNEGLAEVMGEESEIGISDAERDPEVRICDCVEKFGSDCTRGMVQRAGRAGLYYWLRDNVDTHGWQEPEYRLLSFRQKVMRGVGDITAWLEKNSLNKFEVNSVNEKLVIQYTTEHPSNPMDCAFYLGLFQEFLSWTASGKFFQAAEVSCPRETKGSHVFEFRLNPLD